LTRTEDPAGGSKQLVRTGGQADYAVALTSGEGRTSHYGVERLPGGERVLHATAADGTESETLIGSGGQRLTTTADGMIRSLERTGDPRFGLVAPLPDAVVSTPGGRTLSMTTTRTTLLDDEADPLSLLAQTSLPMTVRQSGSHSLL
jgi:hypothetical protein